MLEISSFWGITLQRKKNLHMFASWIGQDAEVLGYMLPEGEIFWTSLSMTV